jgi:hypothetical protein
VTRARQNGPASSCWTIAGNCPGLEVALRRILPHVRDADVRIILGENGPLRAELESLGVAVEVMASRPISAAPEEPSWPAGCRSGRPCPRWSTYALSGVASRSCSRISCTQQ